MLTLDFKKLTVLKPSMKILDLGCGEGRHTIGAYWLLQDCNIIGVDIARADLNTAQKKFNDFRQHIRTSNSVNFIEANGLQLPFADHSFDLIICSEVLEHIADYCAMMEEIKRLIAPGGDVVLSVPRYWPEKICWWLSDEYHANEGGHIRIFRRHELQQQLIQLGFTLRTYHYAHSLHSIYWWLRCLFWQAGENQWLCRIYHRFLVWDLMKKPLLTRWLDACLNPIVGKSLVMYCQSPSQGS